MKATTDEAVELELESLGWNLSEARAAERLARTKLRTAVIAALDAGMPESHVARAAQVDRMTVRKWRRRNG